MSVSGHYFQQPFLTPEFMFIFADRISNSSLLFRGRHRPSPASQINSLMFDDNLNLLPIVAVNGRFGANQLFEFELGAMKKLRANNCLVTYAIAENKRHCVISYMYIYLLCFINRIERNRTLTLNLRCSSTLQCRIRLKGSGISCYSNYTGHFP